MSTKHDVHMILIMVPLFQRDVIRRAYADEYILCVLAHLIREYFSAILHHQNQMVVEQEH